MTDVSHLIDKLNPAQRAAVTAPLQHVLVLAGAGSGKTRVLVHRIAWLLATKQAHPYNLLAVTFTNKAANEMQNRVQTLLNNPSQSVWVGTFHGIAHRLLRIHWQEAQLPKTFQVLDSDDQQRTLKRVIRELQFDEKKWTPKQTQSFVNNCKDNGLRAQDIVIEPNDVWTSKMASIYRVYQETCQRLGLVDFAELLLRTYELLRDNQALREHYQQRFQHLLVDEFQDTNTIQNAWLQLLAGTENKLFVVGDEDQSIYGWRGAKIQNILQFNESYQNVLVIRLEQNYRSTGTILAAANALIAHNTARLGKNLWTANEAGEPVHLYNAFNETDEAQFVVERIEKWTGKRKDVAILYRTAAQSRLFEEVLLEKGIPYRIYGGLRFYERAEIKDVLAYLRLLSHYDDDGAFERIINTPKRGIGDKTVESIRSLARQQGLSLWQATQQALRTQEIKARPANLLNEFVTFIQQLAHKIVAQPLDEQVDLVIKNSGLIEHYQKDSKEEAQRRIENLAELVTAAHQFHTSYKDGLDPLAAFLAHATLEAGEGQARNFENCVQLMTLHLAKGLEFQVIFLCGLEEGLFPHENSLHDGNLEEERRLCYVGMTRAQQFLYLCYSESRYHYGTRDFSTPSRFIQEIPAELVQEIRMRYVSPSSQITINPFKIGERVKHEAFGEGTVLEYEGKGEAALIYVRFPRVGNKWLVIARAGLQRA